MRMSLPAQMQNKPIIVIAAISSRPYVKAAVEAGYDVVAIDAFLDQDTQVMAKQTFYVPCVNYQFDASSILRAILAIIEAHGRDALTGFSYGAGFEGQPALIAEIQKHLPLLGNQPSTVKQCKDPISFNQFCQKHGFTTPAITMKTPASPKGWLVKTRGASGGGHIKFAECHADTLNADQYYQQFHAGLPVSCLSLVGESGASVVGVNEQWVASGTDAPFQYGGAVSQFKLSDDMLAEFKHFIALSAAHFGLKGLNSVDALLDDGRLVFLEINPRLSATMDLYSTQESSLLASHVAAFQSKVATLPKVLSEPKAHHIVYATALTHSQADQAWPEWVCDIPSAAQTFKLGMPICTVVSHANTAQAAKQLAQTRAASL
jgi:predicted ATP-grasp superfamily ATP-dependent carboligase